MNRCRVAMAMLDDADEPPHAVPVRSHGAARCSRPQPPHAVPVPTPAADAVPARTDPRKPTRAAEAPHGRAALEPSDRPHRAHSRSRGKPVFFEDLRPRSPEPSARHRARPANARRPRPRRTGARARDRTRPDDRVRGEAGAEESMKYGEFWLGDLDPQPNAVTSEKKSNSSFPSTP